MMINDDMPDSLHVRSTILLRVGAGSPGGLHTLPHRFASFYLCIQDCVHVLVGPLGRPWGQDQTLTLLFAFYSKRYIAEPRQFSGIKRTWAVIFVWG